MACITTERDGGVLIATLSRGKANALDAETLQALHAVVQRVTEDDEIRALVVASGSPRFFSTGFDVGEVFRYDGNQMRSFFSTFIDVYEGLQAMPKGVVAAVSGHAYAGGAVLALACDWQIMTDAPCGFALNEVDVGVILPPGITRLVVNRLGTGYARQLLLSGEPASPTDALRIGLVNELAAPDEVLPRAVSRAQCFASKPPAAFAAIKTKLRNLTGDDGSSDRDRLDPFIAQWESAEGRAARQAILEAMQR